MRLDVVVDVVDEVSLGCFIPCSSIGLVDVRVVLVFVEVLAVVVVASVVVVLSVRVVGSVIIGVEDGPVQCTLK